ncbi:hypothetical protein EYR38_002170 [Pleurotus pulmonarius]|nr:hypothetical protein EYR38_002170 [Pleurotus pulmonarius]
MPTSDCPIPIADEARRCVRLFAVHLSLSRARDTRLFVGVSSPGRTKRQRRAPYPVSPSRIRSQLSTKRTEHATRYVPLPSIVHRFPLVFGSPASFASSFVAWIWIRRDVDGTKGSGTLSP